MANLLMQIVVWVLSKGNVRKGQTPYALYTLPSQNRSCTFQRLRQERIESEMGHHWGRVVERGAYTWEWGQQYPTSHAVVPPPLSTPLMEIHRCIGSNCIGERQIQCHHWIATGCLPLGYSRRLEENYEGEIWDRIKRPCSPGQSIWGSDSSSGSLPLSSLIVAESII